MTRSEIAQYGYLRREVENTLEFIRETEHKMRLKKSANNSFNRYYVKKLRKKLTRCIKQCEEIDDFVNDISDSLTRQIIYERYIRGKTWPAVAMSVGGGNTPDGVRKIAERYSYE